MYRREMTDIKWIFISGYEPNNISEIISLMQNKGTIIREVNNKRSMWRIELHNETFYIKQLRYNTLTSRIFTLLKSNGKYEISINSKLSKANIPVPPIVAFGKTENLGLLKEEYIITKEISGSSTLKNFFFENFQYLTLDEKKKIIRDFAMFIRKLHDNGIVHRDLHSGNILINREDGKNVFFILDLDKVLLKGPLSLQDRLLNLSLLNINFFTLLKDSLRYYFFKCYAEGLWEKEDIKHSLNNIEEYSWNLAFSTWKKKAKRCMGDNRLFRKETYANLKVHVKKGWEGFQDILIDPEKFLGNNEAVLLKNGRTVKAARVTIDNQSFVLKRYNRKGFSHTVKNIFRISRAQKVWRNSYGFELRGVPIPSTIAFIEERKYRILKRSYIISEFIQNALTLTRFIMEKWKDMTPEERKRILSSLSRQIRKMHYLGCFHGDLKWNNIFVKEEDRHYNFYFTDLDGSKVKKKLTNREKIKDIGRFYLEMSKYNIETGLQGCFLKAYYRKNQIAVSYKKFSSDMKIRAERLRKKKL